MSVGWSATGLLSSILAFIALLAAAGCGGDDSPKQATAAGLTVEVPSGWHEREQGVEGLAFAREASSLSSDVPVGPTFHSAAIGGRPAKRRCTRGLGAAVARVRVEPPKAVIVDSHKGASIELTQRRKGAALTAKSVTVATGRGRGYRFILEAPAGQWAASETPSTKFSHRCGSM